VLHDEVPVTVVLEPVEIVDGQLHPPVLSVAVLDVRVRPDRAHVPGAPDSWLGALAGQAPQVQCGHSNIVLL
jgi:hypothetical protein